MRIIMLLVGLLLLTVWLQAPQPLEAAPTWVRQRVRDIDLTSVERKWERIGWLTDMGRALELSRRLQRPILILAGAGTLDGRC